jgi:hypothetical protein
MTHSWGCMGEVSLRHQVVGLDDLVDVAAVDADSYTHDHMLRSLDNLAIDAEEVRPLEGLETKVVVRKVSVVDDRGIEDILVVHYDLVDIIGDHRRVLIGLGVDPVVEIGYDCRECLLGLLVEVGDGNTSGENGVVRVLGREVCSGLRSEILLVSDAKRIDSRQARRW